MTIRLTGSTSGYTEIDAPAVAGSNTLVLPTGNGTADQALVTNGSGALSWADRGRMVLSTAQNSTSGTSIDFTGIPSWVKRVTVMFNGVSTNGTSLVHVQLGTSAGFQTTGYNTIEAGVAGTNTTSISTSTIGATLSAAGSDKIRFGNIIFCSMSNTAFSYTGITGNAGSGNTMISGFVTLSGTLDRIRITTVNGTDTFDAGTINILMEG
jgi:hypothetical protein